MKIKYFVEIIRPLNCLMAALAVFIGFSVAIGGLSFGFPLLFAMLAALFICAGGQVINDFFDVEIDKISKPQKILPSKKISIHTALIYSVALFLVGLTFASILNQSAFIIAIAFTALLILYSAFIQRQKIIGNFVVAISTAFTLIFGASLVENYNTVFLIAASAFFANYAREIIKDLQDVKSDEGHKKTIAMILSDKQISFMVLGSYFFALLIAIYVWVSGMLTGIFFPILLLVAIIVFIQSFKLLLEKKVAKAQLYSKIAMAISLFAFLAGVF